MDKVDNTKGSTSIIQQGFSTQNIKKNTTIQQKYS